METIINVKDLRKSFGNSEVLKGIDVQIEKGEFVEKTRGNIAVDPNVSCHSERSEESRVRINILSI